MNIVEWRYQVAKTMDDQKRDDIRDHMNIIPGILHSKFVQNEGYMSVTLDTDLCSVDEVYELMESKIDYQIESELPTLNSTVNHLFKRLFKL